MSPAEIRELLLMLIPPIAVIVVLGMVIKILFKARRGPKVKKRKEAKVLKAVSSGPDSDSIFNTIISTKRIASNLEMKGIDTSKAKILIERSEAEYDQGKEERAKITIEEAKELLLEIKSEWDKKTGFDVVPSTQTSENKSTFKQTVDLTSEGKLEPLKLDEEIPDLTKAIKEKPDNYLPSKFTISLAGTAIENAKSDGADVNEAQKLFLEAKSCFDREDYDLAFKLALDCKRNAEALLGGAPAKSEKGEKVMSDLAMDTAEVEELKICDICGERKVPYICIKVDGGEEATCKECYEKSMGKAVVIEAEPSPKEIHEEKEKGVEKEEREKKEEVEEENLYCPNCGAKTKTQDVFCGKCGKPVKEELKCVGCGTKVEPGDLFCRKCGARLVT